MLRKHQNEYEVITDEIIYDKSGVNIIDIIATPGAGKSTIPIQACRLIKAGLADAILWVVPRSALQNQGERGFLDPFFKDLFNHDFIIRESTNEINPCRGTNGFITTYQAIAADKEQTVLREVRSKRYIVVADEYHHLEKDGVWHEHIDPIVQAGHFLIKMTGTLGRGDKKEIAYVNYRNLHPYFCNEGNQRVIIYSRTDALKEKAILPIEFFLSDGSFKWKKPTGKISEVKSFLNVKTPTQQGEALFTALNSDFANELLTECASHWIEHREKNSGAKLLIVTSGYEMAKKAVLYLKQYTNVSSEIATSHKTKKAVASINKFKAGTCECLVTITMAYEGLDVPGITHICVLTNIRSREWIEQMLARGVRIDRAITAGPYETQKCYIFAPADKGFNKIVDIIKSQQVSAIEYFSKIKEDEEDEGIIEEVEEDIMEDEKKKEYQGVIPLSSKMTDRTNFLLDGKNSPVINSHIPIITIKEQELDIRKKIQKYINQYCRKYRYEPQTINHEIKKHFDKARNLLTLEELKNLMKYIEINYPLKSKPIEYVPRKNIIPLISEQDDIDIKNMIAGYKKNRASGPRGTGKRVTSKIEPWILKGKQ